MSSVALIHIHKCVDNNILGFAPYTSYNMVCRLKFRSGFVTTSMLLKYEGKWTKQYTLVNIFIVLVSFQV